MIFKKKKAISIDLLEQRLDTISDLTRGLGKTEFNNLIESVKLVFEARQKLTKVKTDDEKEYGDINKSDRELEKEKEKEMDLLLEVENDL